MKCKCIAGIGTSSNLSAFIPKTLLTPINVICVQQPSFLWLSAHCLWRHSPFSQSTELAKFFCNICPTTLCALRVTLFDYPEPAAIAGSREF